MRHSGQALLDSIRQCMFNGPAKLEADEAGIAYFVNE
jgi:hypothetical protein